MAAPDMAESLHYETRSIREQLAASNVRLHSARQGKPRNLQPQQGSMMLHEWQGLANPGSLDDDDTPASSNPQYRQMRDALLAFERDVAYAAPARERAFFTALRTQLMEAAAQGEPEHMGMRIAAAFKWFSRHKPQGPEADPVAAAVLASSLSVEAAGGAQQQSRALRSMQSMQQHNASMQRRLDSEHAAATGYPPQAAGGWGPGGASAPGGPSPGNKHQFFTVYSRASGGAGPPVGGAGHERSASGRAAGGTGAGSLSVNHPLVMHPTVAGGQAHARAGAAGASGGGAAAAGGGGGAQPHRARFAGADMYAPSRLVRPQELDEVEHRAAQAAAAAAVAGGGGRDGGGGGGGGGGGDKRGAGAAKPWVSGPFKASVGTGGGGGDARGARGRDGASGVAAGPGPDDDQEIRALREKWSLMDARTAQSVQDVQNKVAEWTLQRARLEEEIVRRQEASRFAAPSGAGAGGGNAPWQQHAGGRQPQPDDGSLPHGTLSPYANANADLAAATAAATSGQGGGGGGVSFMLPGSGPSLGPTLSGASMRMRHAEINSYDMGRSDLVVRLARLGVAVNSDTLDRALRPVEDRPFLDCIARLPKPGDSLVSRPGSVRVPAAKKKKPKSASGKNRPKSGK